MAFLFFFFFALVLSTQPGPEMFAGPSDFSRQRVITPMIATEHNLNMVTNQLNAPFGIHQKPFFQHPADNPNVLVTSNIAWDIPPNPRKWLSLNGDSLKDSLPENLNLDVHASSQQTQAADPDLPTVQGDTPETHEVELNNPQIVEQEMREEQALETCDLHEERFLCPGFMEAAEQTQAKCEELECCWDPRAHETANTHQCFKKTAHPRPTVQNADTAPLPDFALARCELGATGFCIELSRHGCSEEPLPDKCPGRGENVKCCPEGAEVTPVQGEVNVKVIDDEAEEEQNVDANGMRPVGELHSCGSYATAPVLTLEGNGGVFHRVVRLLQKHFLAQPDDRHDSLVPTELACAFDKMFDDAKKDEVEIKIRAGFRTLARQKYFYNEYQCTEQEGERVCKNGPIAPLPGSAVHGTGRAIDIEVGCAAQQKDSPVSTSCTRDPVYGWLRQNARKFGFVRTIDTEPWHWEFLGNEVPTAPSFQ